MRDIPQEKNEGWGESWHEAETHRILKIVTVRKMFECPPPLQSALTRNILTSRSELPCTQKTTGTRGRKTRRMVWFYTFTLWTERKDEKRRKRVCACV